jgi:hypothetical protein
MRKKYYTTAVIVSILTMLLTLAAGPIGEGSTGSRSATLVAMRFITTKGYVFIFSLSGQYKKRDLIGSVILSERTVKLSCILRDDIWAVCTAPGLKKYIGKSAWVVLAGFGQSVIIPKPRINNNVDSCYSIFDWNATGDDWQKFADYCQSSAAEVGDAINMYNPIWNGTYTYIYQNSVPCSNQGNGYYYGVTFENYYSIVCP